MRTASESQANRQASKKQIQKQKQGLAPSAEGARARTFEEHEFVAMAWQALSKYPAERGIAAARWKSFGDRLDPTLGLYALCEIAHHGYHAYMFTERVALERQARLREIVVDQDKARYEREARAIIDLLRGAA